MDQQKFYTPVAIPDGEYRGRWGGYVIDFEHDGREVNVHTKLGVRGMNIPVTFQIVDGRLDDDSIKTHNSG